MGVKFKAIKPEVWNGRYARIPGDGPAMHIKTMGGMLRPVVYLRQDECLGTCSAVENADVRKLTEAVSTAKLLLSGHEGGSFQINEYGQVLVPASHTYKRMLVGEVSGELQFHNPFEEGAIFSLNDDDGLRPGDAWPWPYVGMPYNLNKGSRIYFWLQNEEGGQSVFPPGQNRPLVVALRGIRRYGAMRFIVNPHGIVLTRRPPTEQWTGEEETWTPVYVGRLNYSTWFQKED